MKVWLGNYFSLEMLDLSKKNSVEIAPVAIEEVAASGFESCVQYQDAADALSFFLGGVEVPVRRDWDSIDLDSGDVLYIPVPIGTENAFLKVTLA